MALVRRAPRPPVPAKENRVIIVTGSAFAGKSTTIKLLAQSDPRVQVVPLVYARKPLEHEVDGEHGHFRTPKAFLQEEAAGLYAAVWAGRDGVSRAILRREVEALSEGGCWVLVELPLAAAAQARLKGLLGKYVCLTPRNLSHLRSRMRSVGVSPESADKLVLSAAKEADLAGGFTVSVESLEGDPVAVAREVASVAGLDADRVHGSAPITRVLYPHQVPVLEWMKKRRHPALFLDMRLGKTIITLRWLRWLSEREALRRVLVVTPISAMMDWADNTRIEGAEWRRIHGQFHKRMAAVQEDPPPTGFRVYGINYEMIRQTPQLGDIAWDAIICDESTHMRSPTSEVGRVLRLHFLDTKHRVILAGEPMPEGLDDIWAQLTWLSGGTWMGYKRFARWRRRWFIPADDRGWNWSPTKEGYDRIQEEIQKKAYILKRKDASVGTSKAYERRMIPMHHLQLAAFRLARDEFAREVEADPKRATTKHAVTRWIWMQRISGGMDAEGTRVISDRKIVELRNLLTGDLKGEPVVVWFRFNAEIAAAKRYLESSGIFCEYINGGVDQENREKIVRRFREGKTRVLLMQLATSKHGLDLSCADTAIYYSNSYSRETRVQTEDRIVRLGKQGAALIIDLVTEQSTDGMILEALKEKGMTSDLFMQRARKWALIRSAKVRTGRVGEALPQRSFSGWHG